MTQTELMQLAASMKPGQAFDLSPSDVMECARGMLSSGFDGSPRRSDLDDFVAACSDNWGVTFTYNPFNGKWIMSKRSNS